ncbi:hypothetical protein TVAG_249470 [Trichomonas vaginalis G3]|uniref:Uncharacterized protein n=1 Tax=Trichomonas vaginalis (strain ATCC PRA-98 / G3) TaxID=412133 RepID=A2DCF0_TRIV3|nr:protein of unknown function, DUF4107 family [Trichomonas vaginalis G3]XP_001582873.1 protein of unknown function, DUF4107 family [Trichomonas vaginalis G3]EAY18533.1 hypothetical protein TVAG_083890 [Trichomonas vaginalis G3]EAY21887.1 hypothetical protein TVAG_249470 [Trichomonas vaginalis G3]KAI5487637.1 protein of unknown function, DUF4107 family [Trichomonas vaginalis G3]KAI5489478.1 protein of unknown function, DUF4107 family [Trichomonas vaginalis G3]|eukprot:XP_001579519.1 hypothetical protein [Trichomonas vaginalis G3]
MVFSTLSALYGGYKAIDGLTGGAVSKALKNNAGMLVGAAARKLKSEKLKKLGNWVADQSQNLLGEDNEISKQLKDFKGQLNGEEFKLNSLKEKEKQPEYPPIEAPPINSAPAPAPVTAVAPYDPGGYGRPFDPKTGGSNWFHYGRRYILAKIAKAKKLLKTKKKPRVLK